MLSRRRYLESNEQVPKMTTESGMRHFMEVRENFEHGNGLTWLLSIPDFWNPYQRNQNVSPYSSLMQISDMDVVVKILATTLQQQLMYWIRTLQTELALARVQWERKKGSPWCALQRTFDLSDSQVSLTLSLCNYIKKIVKLITQ